MGRITRILNYTITAADTWYKVFDEDDYQKNRIKEIKVKLRENTTADHFRYAFDSIAPSTWMTSTTGWITIRDVTRLYVYVPDVAAQVLEIEVVYR